MFTEFCVWFIKLFLLQISYCIFIYGFVLLYCGVTHFDVDPIREPITKHFDVDLTTTRASEKKKQCRMSDHP